MNELIAGDFGVCKDAANQFYYVAKWCYNRDALSYMTDTFYPYAVNVSFACELYLKAISIFRSPCNEFHKGHNLKELFEELPVSDKSEITKLFDLKYTKTDILDFLDNSKNVFVEWRYALEKEVYIDLSGFEIFSSILNEYIRKLEES